MSALFPPELPSLAVRDDVRGNDLLNIFAFLGLHLLDLYPRPTFKCTACVPTFIFILLSAAWTVLYIEK